MANKVITKTFWDFTFIAPNIEGCFYKYKDYLDYCKECDDTPVPINELRCKLLEYDYFQSTKRTKADLQKICGNLYHLHDKTDDNDTYTYLHSSILIFNMNDLEIKGKELKNILSKPDIKIRQFNYKTTIIKKNKSSANSE